jgi:hypothetical protein
VCITLNTGRILIVSPSGLVLCRAKKDGTFTDYLEIPWSELIFVRGGFYPLLYLDVGNKMRRDRVYALFMPRFETVAEWIETGHNQGASHKQQAASFLTHVEHEIRQFEEKLQDSKRAKG